MKRFLNPSLLLTLLCVPLGACSSTPVASPVKYQQEGDTFVGQVIESSPERITIKIKDRPELLVIEQGR